jgi:hypothetical protein
MSAVCRGQEVAAIYQKLRIDAIHRLRELWASLVRFERAGMEGGSKNAPRSGHEKELPRLTTDAGGSLSIIEPLVEVWRGGLGYNLENYRKVRESAYSSFSSVDTTRASEKLTRRVAWMLYIASVSCGPLW